jgi:hypothetical protein
MRDEKPEFALSRDRLPTIQRLFIYLAVSLAVAVLGAERFALAAGMPAHDQQVALCGFVLGFLTLALLMSVVHFTRQVIVVLTRTSARPGPTVGLTLIVCGTVCILGALALQFYATARPGGGSAIIGVPGAGVTARVAAEASSASLLTLLATVAVFLAGAALVALGVWSASSPRGAADTPPHDRYDDHSASPHVTVAPGRSPAHEHPESRG